MPDDLVKAMQAVIDQAAKTTPARTGEVERYSQRLRTAGSATVVLADVSGSMAEPAGQKLKIDVLREAMQTAVPADAIIIAFSSLPRQISSAAQLPHPDGGTALHLALDEAAKHRPRYTLVITDGRPDLPEVALERVTSLPGILDVIYCGPDSDIEAILFIRKLAQAGGGQAHVHDIRQAAAQRALAPAIRAALEAPRKG
jgi:predicted metal-dependent peptidase